MNDTTITGLPLASGIDPIADWIPIDRTALNVTQRINRNTYLGITGSPVGTTDTQTLTNKTISSPAISSPVLSGTITGTYTLGGTPTFPSTVVTTTGTQTLTNKTLTSPTINGGSIDSTAITVDTITGKTSSTSGTIFGMPITTGKVGTNGVVANSITDGSVTGTKIGASAITLASVPSTTSQTGITSSPVILTGLTTTVTVPTGGRRVRIEVLVPAMRSSSISATTLYIYNSATVTGSPIQTQPFLQAIAAANISGFTFFEHTPAAGSQSYCAAISVDAGTGQTALSSSMTAFLTVKVL